MAMQKHLCEHNPARNQEAAGSRVLAQKALLEKGRVLSGTRDKAFNELNPGRPVKR